VHYFAKLELPGSKTKTATCFGFISSLFRLLFLWFFLFVCFSLLLILVFFFKFRLSLITDLAVLKEVQQSLSPASFSVCYPVRISLFPFFILPVLSYGLSASSSSPFPSVLSSFLSPLTCFFLSSPSFFFSSPSVSSFSFPFPSVFSPSPLTFLFSPLLFLTLSFSVPFFLFFFSLFSSLSRSPSSVSAPPHCLVPSSVFLFFVVQCWCDCDGEWQWLLDKEDDELTMALAVLVRLSPLLYSFLCRSPLVFPLLSFLPFFIVFSLAFISQRMACGATSNLVTACRGIVAVKHSP